jgi:hypothetical protein
VKSQTGQVITGQQMNSVPLNGRSYTDLLSLQSGVAPITTVTSDMVQDARNYFSPTRGEFDQNQFGATVGGPILKNKMFFFAHCQGTRLIQGIDTGEVVTHLCRNSGYF